MVFLLFPFDIIHPHKEDLTLTRPGSMKQQIVHFEQLLEIRRIEDWGQTWKEKRESIHVFDCYPWGEGWFLS